MKPVTRGQRVGRAVRAIGMGTLVAAALGVSAGPARADVVLLNNGDHVSGELQLTELEVVTAEGVVRLGPAAVARVTLGTIAGDVVTLRSGRALTGLVAQATYPIRLGSGQTVVLPRQQLGVLLLTAR